MRAKLSLSPHSSAVSQSYTTKAPDEYVILGNDVVVACKVPSFVADFVDVVGWVDGASQEQQELGRNGSVRASSLTYFHIIGLSCD